MLPPTDGSNALGRGPSGWLDRGGSSSGDYAPPRPSPSGSPPGLMMSVRMCAQPR